MGDFGEGPLGTKLGQGATAVKYPRPTRVKNKTPAPTQVRRWRRRIISAIPEMIPRVAFPSRRTTKRSTSSTHRPLTTPPVPPPPTDHRGADRPRGEGAPGGGFLRPRAEDRGCARAPGVPLKETQRVRRHDTSGVLERKRMGEGGPAGHQAGSGCDRGEVPTSYSREEQNTGSHAGTSMAPPYNKRHS